MPAGDDPESDRMAEFRDAVAAARAGDPAGVRRARLWAGMRAGYDDHWDALIADAEDVVGPDPRPAPGYEAAAVWSAVRAPSGRVVGGALIALGAVLLALLLWASV